MSADATVDVVVSGAGTDSVNGTYRISLGITQGDRPVYVHTTNPEHKIQWSITRNFWIVDDTEGDAPYKADGRTETTVPLEAEWSVFQGGEKPPPKVGQGSQAAPAAVPASPAAQLSQMVAVKAPAPQVAQELRPFDDEEQVIRAFLLRSPPQQVGEIAAHCRKLMKKELQKDLAASACCERNEAGPLVLPLGTHLVGIVCAAARLDNAAPGAVAYCNPRGEGCVFEVDHEKLTCLSVSKALGRGMGSAEAEPYRLAVERELDAYQAKHFSSSSQINPNRLAACAVYSHGRGAQNAVFDVCLQIAVSSRHARPRACWAGSWGSTWSISFTPGQAKQAVLAGQVVFMSHYCEESNVQMQRRHKVRSMVTASTDAAVFARNVVAAIGDAEDSFQENTDDLCASFGNGVLKGLRRVLPLSRERFDWKPLRHALVRDMKEAATSREGGC